MRIILRFAAPLIATLLAAPAWSGAQRVAHAEPVARAQVASGQVAGPSSPADLFGELFVRVQLAPLFRDSKTFVDAVPRRAPSEIMADYRRERPADTEALRRFVLREFSFPPQPAAAQLPSLSLRDHIAALWPHLVRPPLSPPAYSSALPLDRPFIVPGGRYQEFYYWDAYFTMLGLVRDGRAKDVTAMADNFADLLARYGHIPNGTRSYYLSRSQPPFFYQMVALTSPADPAAADARYLDALMAEHRYWMDGAKDVRPGTAAKHVVRLADGTLFNRYWDARATPRDESYREDVATAAASGRPVGEVYRDLRAAAESGWDFSSRWLADGRRLETIETTALVPVDLNALLYGLEQAIAAGCTRRGDRQCAAAFDRQAKTRAAAIRRYLWDDAAGAFADLHWQSGRRSDRLTIATTMPLYVGLATRAQADRVARTVEARLLRPGGVATTTAATGQQWDEPNGWAPLQWIAITGLDRYGHKRLADAIATRWVRTVAGVYARDGRLVEKYDVDTGRPGGGGEYPVQDGFGWTNGVTRALLDRPGVSER
ncbi:alpha,alpha-trehalase [Sphingomonas gellani]|uniref:Alpha,alpha-trehalase n=1 Tax=Sphingomonas gellani TaxID=1166340 RepID=A0A1H8GPW4_9SPHN|nr:alpha,alpha-trehalase TreF [Sphingomonas gellani]SEN45318.1 alpha,alpha-trehalase [Sphingomonas gellani]